MKYRLVSAALALALCATAVPVPAPAALPGIAYDEVVKFSMGSTSVPDPATLDFTNDYRVAASTSPPSAPRGGMLGALAGAAGMGGQMMTMMQNGTASRKYVAGQYVRTDSPAAQTATILNCANRTVVHLNLANKTYTIESLDQPQTASRGRRGDQPRMDDPNTRTDITLVGTNLGAKTVFGTPTNGYNEQMTMTSTDANGKTGSMQLTMTGYYSGMNDVAECSPYRGAGSAGPMAMIGQMQALSRAFGTARDPRFTFHATGPTPPTGKFAPFIAMVPQGSESGGPMGGNFMMLMERGNVRAITDADPIFQIPSDFTKAG